MPTKAVVEVLDKDAVDALRGLPELFQVQFNPTEYALEKGAQIAEIAIPGIDSPILQFIRGQNEKLHLDLFFDTTSQGMAGGAVSVTTLTKSFYQLVKMQPKTHAPPRIRFSWGHDLNFVAIVESVQEKFTLFSPDGTALRATLSVVLREYKSSSPTSSWKAPTIRSAGSPSVVTRSRVSRPRSTGTPPNGV
jgi:hypothetical protein